MTPKKISLTDIEAFVFDFDGVLTDNTVYLNQDGLEWVCCSRSDGLAFDVLRKLNKPAYILSTETSPVVTARANKLKVTAVQGVEDKVATLKDLAWDCGFSLSQVLYVGNDLNDFHVMESCGYSVCPSDSHELIKSIATITLETEGGCGVVRELLEGVLKIDFLQVLYAKKE